MMLSELVERFLTSITVKDRVSKITVVRYRASLSDFLRSSGDMPIDTLNLEHIETYQAAITGASNTVSTKLSALRAFVRWAWIRGYRLPIVAEAIELPKIRREVKDIPSKEEVEKLLASTQGYTKEGLRNKAILLFLATSGVRVHELVNLKRDDLFLERCTARIMGKGGKERLALYSPMTGKLVGKYLSDRGDKLPYVFTRMSTNRKGPLTTRSIQRMIERQCQIAGVKHYSCHAFRHFFATYSLSHGTDLFTVSRFLGHANVNTTSIYLHVGDKQLEESHRKIFKRYTLL